MIIDYNYYTLQGVIFMQLRRVESTELEGGWSLIGLMVSVEGEKGGVGEREGGIEGGIVSW